ncbi:MAG: ABC transporter ATP-binding protein [Lachnospiraceae bacterium]|nr:ABC transporter ATP-binding protein [Lachnospiraceae bacterium]
MELLRVEDLTLSFHEGKGIEEVVEHVSFSLNQGEVLGIVGESGSGKSMVVHCIMGLHKKNQVVESGRIWFDGQELLGLGDEQMRALQGNEMSIVFQEPMTSLNPVMKIGPQVEESLYIHRKDLSPAQRKSMAIQAMKDVELPNAEELYSCYPHELSGGMRQRVMIAAAIVCGPKLLIADEATTALDVTIQAQIIRLLKKLNRSKGMSVLFISHNLRVIREICTRTIVMKNGRIVEEGSVEDIFRSPKEDYTKNLIAAIPTRQKRRRS